MKQMGTLGLAMLVVLSASASDPKDATKPLSVSITKLKQIYRSTIRKTLKMLKKVLLPNKTLSRLKMIMVT